MSYAIYPGLNAIAIAASTPTKLVDANGDAVTARVFYVNTTGDVVLKNLDTVKYPTAVTHTAVAAGTYIVFSSEEVLIGTTAGLIAYFD